MISDELTRSSVTKRRAHGSIREQNVQVAAGVVGAAPMPEGVAYQLSVNARGRLTNEEEFGDIIVKTGDKGEMTRLRDVARIELAAGSYSLRSQLNNKPAVGIGIFQAPGSNALELSDQVRATMEQVKRNMPEGVDYTVVYDPTRFVRESISEVVKTLFEATLLVVIVVVVFLQTWRASIIPLVAVPARRRASPRAPPLRGRASSAAVPRSSHRRGRASTRAAAEPTPRPAGERVLAGGPAT